MPRTIHKYSIPIVNRFTLGLPLIYNVIAAGTQGPDPTEDCKVWIELDSDDSIHEQDFGVFGTGHYIPDGAVHQATFQAPPFIWHFYSLN